MDFELFKHFRICNPHHALIKYLAGRFSAASLEEALNALVVAKYVRTPQSNNDNQALPFKSDLLKQLANYVLAASSEDYTALDVNGKIWQRSEAIEKFWRKVLDYP